MCHTSNKPSCCWRALLLLLAVSGVIALADDVALPAAGTNFCPKICTCDVIENLKRADCSNENLINTYTDVPYGVEILDLSINIISSIEDDSFQHYDNLLKLFLSENSIQTISLDAFANQRRLKTLDLSYNRLEHLHEQLFERNVQLVEINLSGNNFMMLPDKPFLKSYSIVNLHLANCRIPHVFDTLFIDLPNLQTLDLSKNIMNGLATVPFAHLRKLNSINLLGNRWNCNADEVRNTIRWMKVRVPDITIESCLLSDLSYNGNKFDRMMIDPALEKRNRQDVAIEDVWGTELQSSKAAAASLWPAFMNRTCSYSDHADDPSKASCEQFVECQQKYGELYHVHKQVLARKSAKCSSYFRTGVFVGGVLVGILFGSFTTYTIGWVVRSCRKRSAQKRANRSVDQKRLHRELRREIRGRNQFEHTRLNESPVPARSERFPEALRQSAAAGGQEEIYRNHEHTRQFLLNLFSKRQPRYVRSNSQLANINNRYIPPTQIRCGPGAAEQPVTPRAVSHPVGQPWEHPFNNDPGVQDQLRYSIEQEPTWISIDRPAGVIVTPAVRQDSATSFESPPPPYLECALDIEPKQERVSMY